jgi:hypothetical protein
LIKDEVEALMRLGAEVTQVPYHCKRTNIRRVCITPKNLREVYVQDGNLFNIKCIHWIFYELPVRTHQDALLQRRSHMDLEVEYGFGSRKGRTYDEYKMGTKEGRREKRSQ